ncbi:MAG: energy-coupling factor transporter transmembrane protein EcfT [Burkholderiaceae bacterium]|jgi:biotin transport system permease protein|nr:energy-coupling factor transporter transmembrane protein EcfT [Burkholderiaceae bacterium]MDP4970146.1 energy-coupling factor transporter transmembrane protein EcfT [Burkholderiaceae bacterium]MDP5112278.1 energy-coupling factor transporter transmembrane protein EcfT [Burkholderiaceae bacterium]
MGSFYFPGNSWLHRSPAGVKLAVLMLAGAGLMWVRDWTILLLVLTVVLVLLYQSGVGVQQLWLQLKTLSWLVLVLVLFTAIAQSPLVALEVGLRICALLLGALLVSMTTSIARMMEVLIWLLQPLQKLGWVNSERVALVFGLTLRLIPELSVQWQEIREAQAARGLSANPFTMGVPMLLRTLRRAQDIADALDARQ